ncbi:hypothetical protein K1719_031952 [Acacia pycnantha]|nr:hypothetical protein K1719_031952 [Acacia pycnantha]
MDDCCAACAEPLEWVAYSPCLHREVCSTCVARLRLICVDRRCCICKTQCDRVFVTKNIHNLTFPTSFTGAEATYRLFNASIHKVSLSKDLCRLVVMCSGDLVEVDNDSRQIHMDGDVHGLHCLAYYYILE